MGLTLIEKILLRASGKKELKDFVYAKIDFCFGNDITAPLALRQFESAGFKKVFNRSRIGFVCDHFVPARDLKAANNVKMLRDFSRRFKIKNFFDINNCGIEHAFLLETALFSPGSLIIGADSHTCTFGAIGCASFGVGSTDLAAAMSEGRSWFKVPSTIQFIYKGRFPKWVCGKDLILHTIGKIGVDGALYKVMEFSGPVIRKLGIEGRLTMTNMAVEAGAKTGIIEPDELTVRYLKKVTNNKTPRVDIEKLKSDKDAKYDDVIEIDITKLEPQVSCPHLPSNAKPVRSLSKVKLTQVVIGSCTNGRISDLRIAASLLKGKKVKKDLRVIIIPATPSIFRQAVREGLISVFAEAGCVVSPPTCGPCLGGHMGILDDGEAVLATTNRNFIGRMGSPKSFVYLGSPAVAAASAIKGRIAHPDEVHR
ncbi:MAG: 3-isopropylmalate dehydratase large subunit [Candidatus Omnitrophica bacterium 4484_171]|nr:MAG: 3-isopropylmalate dehydratase large subunit [Candidatus Omnitrophica bacterium 4484_171]